tara:strand:- start:128 stop:307 length:180 start_codon:yes stop_codon:yes gene_type:complete
MMPVLPKLSMNDEREELVKKMAKPFRKEPNYLQTKQSFTCFVSQMSAPNVLHCLAVIEE